jgi:HPt (histidine-containing phosphotransfer) domain-containing protein
MSAPIDVTAGIERVMGDRALYARVLERFRSEYRGFPETLRSALAAGDAALAVRLAHSLKGASGMIEAGSLHGCAQALEQALRAGQDDPAAHLGRTEAELERVLGEIDRLLSAAAAAAQAPQPATGGEDVVGRLRRLLDAGDGAATEILRSERPTLQAALGAGRLARVAAAVEAFEFEAAARLIASPDDGQ